MASNEGFLNDEQRELLKVASQNAEMLSSSPKSPTSLFAEHPIKVLAGGRAPTVGFAVRHVRRSHSASEPAKLLVVSYKLDVLCYAVKGLPVAYAVSKLIIPGSVDQLNVMKNSVLPSLSTQHPQLRPYHFCPPGVLHTITVLYELSYGEIEMKQGSALLKDVHTEIPSSDVSGGLVSLVKALMNTITTFKMILMTMFVQACMHSYGLFHERICPCPQILQKLRTYLFCQE